MGASCSACIQYSQRSPSLGGMSRSPVNTMEFAHRTVARGSAQRPTERPSADSWVQMTARTSERRLDERAAPSAQLLTVEWISALGFAWMAASALPQTTGSQSAGRSELAPDGWLATETSCWCQRPTRAATCRHAIACMPFPCSATAHRSESPAASNQINEIK